MAAVLDECVNKVESLILEVAKDMNAADIPKMRVDPDDPWADIWAPPPRDAVRIDVPLVDDAASAPSAAPPTELARRTTSTPPSDESSREHSAPSPPSVSS